MINKLIKIFEESKKIAILTHINPDGDAYGSSLMIYEFLKENFPDCEKGLFYDTSEISPNFKNMLDGIDYNSSKEDFDTVVSVDCGDKTRFSKFSHIFENAKHTISFDHHPNNPMFAELNFVDIVSSNCENIYNVLKKTKLKLNKQLLKYCYVGMLTDTKNFTINSVSASTHKIVSEIMSEGINTHEIYNCIFDSREKSEFELLTLAMKKTKFFLNNKVMISSLTSKDFKKCGLSEDDTHGLIGELFHVKDCLACFFITPRNGKLHISMRSKQGVDVSIIAKKLGGGGHVCASACETDLKLKKAVEFLLAEIAPQTTSYVPDCKNIFKEE